MMKIAAAVAAFLLLSVQAQAASQPVSETLTMQQAQELIAALGVIAAGSPEQCDPKNPPKPEANTPVRPGADKPCPFHKSDALRSAVSRNLAALKGIDEEFRHLRDMVRDEVMSGLPIDPSLGASDNETVMKTRKAIIDDIQSRREIKYSLAMVKPLKEQRPVAGMVHFKVSDLKLGEAPERNALNEAVVAALAPILDDFVPTQ